MLAPRSLARVALAVVTAVGTPAAALAPAAYEPEEIAIIVNLSVPVTALTAAELAAIFTSTKRTWADGRPIIAFNYPPDDRARILFDAVVLGMTPAEVGRFWVDQRIRGGARPPRQVTDAALALRLIARLPGSIGYVPARLVDASVRVVARVRGSKVVER